MHAARFAEHVSRAHAKIWPCPIVSPAAIHLMRRGFNTCRAHTHAPEVIAAGDPMGPGQILACARETCSARRAACIRRVHVGATMPPSMRLGQAGGPCSRDAPDHGAARVRAATHLSGSRWRRWRPRARHPRPRRPWAGGSGGGGERRGAADEHAASYAKTWLCAFSLDRPSVRAAQRPTGWREGEVSTRQAQPPIEPPTKQSAAERPRCPSK